MPRMAGYCIVDVRRLPLLIRDDQIAVFVPVGYRAFSSNRWECIPVEGASTSALFDKSRPPGRSMRAMLAIASACCSRS